VCDLFAYLDSTLTSPSISSTTIGGGGVSSAAVGSNPFAVGGIYPAAMPVQMSPQYMLVQTGSGPCYVPVTNVPFGTTVMSPPPAFSAPAAAQFQLPNPQQQASFAFHGQMHPANPFLVVIYCCSTYDCIDIYTVFKNTIHLTSDHNFGKCRLIFKILSLADFQGNCLCTYDRGFHLTTS